MWTTTKLCAMLLMALCFYSCLPGLGSCSESRMYQISENELMTLEQHLATLEQNNSELLNLLNASELDLNEASRSLSESKKELATLKAQLETLQAETKTLSESLRIANEELAKASASFKVFERERDKIENRLRTQRNVWEALFAVAVGIAIAK